MNDNLCQLSLQKLGKDIEQIRLFRDITRKTLSEKAGISLNALIHLEKGKNASLSTLIATLSALNRLDWLNSLSPQITVNPLKMVRGKKRQRASRASSLTKTGLEHKKDHLKRQYNLTLDQYIHMFEFQNHKCGNPGCNKELDLKSSETCVDHCHTTGKIRSLLCSGCNTALGMISEDNKKAIGLANYISKYAVAVDKPKD